MALLDRLKGILLDPKNEWPKIAAEAATTQSIYTGWVMIFAAIGPLAMLVVGGGATIKFTGLRPGEKLHEELLDSAEVSGNQVADFLKERGLEQVDVQKIQGKTGFTDFIKMTVPGREGKASGGKAPSLGILGRLGGIGARPERLGMVSDADGAVAAVSCALKLADMRRKGDRLMGDVILATHICPDAPTQPHEPVAFMGSSVDTETMNRHEVDPAMDAILSVDTTKGNRIINFRGFAITPTVKEGYILKVSEDLLDILQWSTGRLPRVVPISTQDITPYGNGVFHINSILQPTVATSASC